MGPNAQGKSNLLEAISMLGTGKSFRTSHERDLIRDGFDLAAISGEASLRSGTVRLGCTLAITSRGTRKLYAVNGRSVRYAAYLGSLRVVTFVPADLQLVTGPPAARRVFVNAALAQDQPGYYRELARYHKALTQKAALLRGEGELDRELLKIYEDVLIESGSALMLARCQFIEAIRGAAARAHAQWSSSEHLEVRYEPNVPCEVPALDAVAAAFRARLTAAAGQERLRRTTLVGPHRDDLRLLLDDRSLALYGSQGQHRTAVLALKVAEYSIMHERSGEAPLLLLDDVLSELDAVRAHRFLGGVGAFEQAFITATHLPDGLPSSAVYAIENAAVRPVVPANGAA